jgi:hypothetical protein
VEKKKAVVRRCTSKVAYIVQYVYISNVISIFIGIAVLIILLTAVRQQHYSSSYQVCCCN